MTDFNDLTERERADAIVFCSGDMIIDRITNSVGILIERYCNETISPSLEYGYTYEMCFWKIYWISDFDDNIFAFNGLSTMEEHGLKMSVLIGIYDFHSCAGDDGELCSAKEEKI
ncbi:MAG: hypothetical protein ACW97P_03255 [Candidatus Hodarchaeales archaeon]|jgi:hypothetical protein